MRDRERQHQVAEARSHRATPEELREASKRLKEIQLELSQRDLQPETRNGEDRERRFARLSRLRDMRDEFTTTRPLNMADRPNGALLSLVMVVATVLLCGFCAGGSFIGFQLVNQKPNPLDTTNSFWYNLEQKDSSNYSAIQSSYLAPILRVQYTQTQFIQAAQQADTNYGAVQRATQLGQPAYSGAQTVAITFDVLRGTNNDYKTTLTLILHANAWAISDLGAAIDPSAAGLKPPPSITPTTTGSTAAPPIADRRPIASIAPTATIA